MRSIALKHSWCLMAAILLAGCGPAAEAPTKPSVAVAQPSASAAPAAPAAAASSKPAVEEPQTVQLGGAATGAGTLSADIGDVRPADPAKFHKEPGYSPYAGRRYPDRPYFGD